MTLTTTTTTAAATTTTTTTAAAAEPKTDMSRTQEMAKKDKKSFRTSKEPKMYNDQMLWICGKLLKPQKMLSYIFPAPLTYNAWFHFGTIL